MKNVNLQNQHSLSYFHVVINNKQVDSTSSYNKILQNRLDGFSDMIKDGFSRLIEFSVNYFKAHHDLNNHDHNVDVLSDILYEYKRIQRRGTPILNNMSNQLESKRIDEESFKLLFKIITHQEEMTKEILKKKITADRIETVFNHLRNVPLYLRTDLEIDNLPELKSKDKTVENKSVEKSSMKIVASGYDPDYNNDYKRIA